MHKEDENTKYKKILEKEAVELESQLKTFATQDPENKDNWNSAFPSFGDDREDEEENADEVEDYENKMGVEHPLETRLLNIKSALDRIKNDAYGICIKCGGDIEPERLAIIPEAEDCEGCII